MWEVLSNEEMNIIWKEVVAVFLRHCSIFSCKEGGKPQGILLGIFGFWASNQTRNVLFANQSTHSPRYLRYSLL
jgi:hypothetical protein